MIQDLVQLPSYLLIVLAFIFGTAIGSFLNVLIWRLPREESIQGRSHCPHCNHQLNAVDLIPVLSILLQRGKCRYCGQPVSLRYPLIEVITGTLFAFAMFIFPITNLASILVLIKIAIVIAICIVVFVVDFEHYLILDRVIFPGIALTLIIAIAQDLASGGAATGFRITGFSVLAAAAAAIPFWLIWRVPPQGKWMGFGDVKFVAFMGLALGLPGIVVGLFASFTVGAIVGLFLMVLGKKQFGSRLPFGTFLSLATILALFWGTQLWDFYWRIVV